MKDDLDDIEFSAAPAMWICFAIAILFALMVVQP